MGIKNKLAVVAAAGSSFFGVSAFAAGEAAPNMGSTITNAITAGQSNVSLVVMGVVTLAALAFGLSMIKGWLSK